MKTVTGLMNIEPAAVWVLMSPALKARENEFKRSVTDTLQYVRFNDFGSTHLRVICGQHTYTSVEQVVERVLVSMKV